MDGILETMTIDDVRNFHPEVAVIPIGSTEPHGPHLPYGTDSFIVETVTEAAVCLANAEGARVLCLPTLPISNNVNFKGFPFACRIRVETLMAVLSDMVTALIEEGIRKIVLVNGHGGNEATLQAALRQMYDRFQQTAFLCGCGPLNFSEGLHKSLFQDGSPHAGDMETSLMRHIAPGLVVEAECRPSPMAEPRLPELQTGNVRWVRSWHHFMPASCGGRPDAATPEKGKEFFDACARGLARFLSGLSREPWHAGFPYPADNDPNKKDA